MNPYARLDAGWKHLLATGPKWFMARIWKQCLDLVRTSNAWPVVKARSGKASDGAAS